MTTEPLPADEIARLRLAVMRLARRLRQSAHPQVTPSQLSALASIERAGPLSLRDLAAVEDIQPSTLTAIVAALEAAGLVLREAHPRDRRTALVRVGPAGERLLAEFRQRGSARLAEALGRLDAADRDAILAALPAIERLLGDPQAQGSPPGPSGHRGGPG